MVAQLGNDLAVKQQQLSLAQQQQQQLALGQQTSASDLQQLAAMQQEIHRINERLVLAQRTLARPLLDTRATDTRTTAPPLS